MTSTPVNGAKNSIMSFAVKAPEKVQGAGAAGSFTDVLSKQTEGSQASQKTETVRGETGSQTKVTGSSSDRMNQKSTVKPEKTEAVQNPEEAAGVLQEAGAKTVKEIAEELGVSEEDVLRAMEVLGLTLVDLLQPENLTMVVMQATGETDPMALLTNEQLSNALKNLNQFIQEKRGELQAAFDIPDEQMGDFIKQFQQTEEIPEEFVPAEQTEAAPAGNSKILAETLPEEKETFGTVQDSSSSVSDVAVEFSEKTAQDAAFKDNGKEAGHGTKEGSMQEQNIFLQNLTQGTEAAATAEAVETPFAQPETQRIMDQILNFMKIQIKPEMTQLEMQLHPESLGTVHVHIASREGMITAQFTAQNETVKAALESQMVQLKETFEQQGVKVEAIEVSVQANGFRQEYEGSREHGNTEDDRERKPARRINLNNPAFLEEESLTEEEQLAVSMMEVNGNTVDYMA